MLRSRCGAAPAPARSGVRLPEELAARGGLDSRRPDLLRRGGRALSISRAPVSDAIRRLAVEGLLEILPQVGCRVVLPVPAEVKDLYEVFGATEGVIARLAAERRSATEADDFRRRCATPASCGRPSGRAPCPFRRAAAAQSPPL